MKERPILFRPEMVRAIIAGEKTQTRRICKEMISYAEPHYWIEEGALWFDNNPPERIACPLGRPKDRLWVRETWADLRPHQDRIAYKATDTDIVTKWRPSIHMPKSHSRITLEIVNTRIERLQLISIADALAEGVKQTPKAWIGLGDALGLGPEKFRIAFRALWDEIHGSHIARKWAANPWVWVVEFRISEQGEKQQC